MAKLAGGVAVINVGAATETEMKEKKARVEDALHATRAAVEEGIVPGGGVALLRSQAALDGVEGADSDESIGIRIVHRAVEEPIRIIASNAGAEGSIIVEKVREADGRNTGYNAASGEYEDMVKAGVIDPTKVTRTALQNAASIAVCCSRPRRSSWSGPRPRIPRRRPAAACPAAAWAACTSRSRGGRFAVPVAPSGREGRKARLRPGLRASGSRG